MKTSILVSSLAAIVFLVPQSHAAISTYLTETTVSDGASLHMNWNPTTFWSADVGFHTGGEPLYLTAANWQNDPFDGLSYAQGYIGSWSGTSLNLSTSFIPADSTVDGSLSYSGYIDLKPVDDTSSAFAGLRYDLGGGDYLYGWVNYATNSDSTALTFLGAAFNTVANEPIQAGQTAVSAVPEPASLLGLAGLLSGGFFLRGRRQRAI